MKKYKNCYIVLKGGIIKGYWFTNKFINENNILFKKLENIYDAFYKNDCCVYGAVRSNKNNDNLKIKLCKILDKFYDLDVEITNGFDNKIYKNKNDYKNHILSYGKEAQ